MIEKMDMKSMDITEKNVKKIQALFPNAVTEVIVDGKTTLKIDFDVLKQELSESLIEDKQERYQMTWPDKSKAKVLANSRITSTLRPDKEKSVDFDNTQNLYIEGDNLDVLKLLRETYLGKVKMIYIDPPYNTGNDFVYNDDFSQSSEEYMETSGQYDEEGNRLVKNLESNGRFHTDWLNMIYPRLKVAKDLLSDDGVIFISIDDNEVENLKKVCNEIYGEDNFVAQCIRRTINSGKHDVTTVAPFHEYVLIYAKNILNISFAKKPKDDEERDRLYKETDEYVETRGRFYITQLNKNSLQYSDGLNYPIIGPDGQEIWPGAGFDDKVWIWRWSKQKVKWGIENGFIVFKKVGEKYKVYTKSYEFMDKDGNPIDRNNPYSTLEFIAKEYANFNATPELEKVFNGEKVFDFPKSIVFLKELIKLSGIKEGLIMDFFSGSATMAEALLQLNAEDGGNRKFIMVQLPEECDEKSKAYKAGYKTICEIGEERIRRAGLKIILDFMPELQGEGSDYHISLMNNILSAKDPFDYVVKNGLIDEVLEEFKGYQDVGFRVLKLDSSNMQDVYYNPNAMRQSLLDETIDNVKTDRTPLDLLFQVMLDLGVELSAKIEEKQVNGKTYFVVNGNDLIACFDEDIDNDVITEIAKQQPLYAVFKSTSFATDSASINNEQLFKTYSPSTVIKVI